ncbi:very short patch repair endonuclease [Castellaniella ginsengisoli]|uniref:Very short patch repair endonuclease n=1 Tax=Castellaniella ginsengisoli TaxID=546114 RepID=A0AB39FYA9_9BURK
MPIPTTPQRNRMMSSIRGKDTWPERALRTALFSRGLRYRLHVRMLPGSPDLVLAKYRAVVFIHGCFWHRHGGCRYTTMPRTNTEFWQRKFHSNIDRDRRNVKALQTLGWRVAIIWECALKHSVEDAARLVDEWLHSTENFLTTDQFAPTKHET